MMRGREVLRSYHGGLDAANEHAEGECVESGADGLIEAQLDEGVADVELGLDELVLASLAVELLLIICGG